MESIRPTIRFWHVVLAGFLQNEGQPIGMTRLWYDLHQTHGGPETCVLLREWDSDCDSLAELIWRMWDGQRPRICIYGYSRGGCTAMHLARALGRRGLGVQQMVLSDPVFWSHSPLTFWRGYLPWGSIRVPAKVEHLWWFRQRISWPRGHDLVEENRQTTKIHTPVVAEVMHSYMDDLPAFRDKCMEVARA